jgi:hypothetical protein
VVETLASRVDYIEKIRREARNGHWSADEAEVAVEASVVAGAEAREAWEAQEDAVVVMKPN